MEDEVGIGMGSTSTSLQQHHHINTIGEEPQRKKRCIRYPSDLSTEDPCLVGDSGFGDLPSVPEHGDLEVQSFFDFASHDLIPPIAASVEVEEEEDILKGCKYQEESQSNLSSTSSSDPCYGTGSEGSSSRSSSANDNHQEEEQEEEEDSEEVSQEEDKFLDLILNSKEISGNPSRAAMIQRFLSHLRSNPNDAQLQHLLALLLSGPEFSPPRNRLRHVTTINDAARLLKCSKKALVLTGAGISVSCGIPDFRSKDGLYSRVAKVFPELRDPQSVFDIRLFKRDPRPFFLTAKELYPGQYEPSVSHRFIQKLDERGQLLRNYSQNIDTLESIAGINNVIMCHGSFATATCIRCRNKVSAEEIKDKVMSGEIPYCTACSTPEETSQIQYPLGNPIVRQENRMDEDEDDDMYQQADSFPLPPVVKPDIVFFGEDLPEEFHNNIQIDKQNCDLLLVIGSSLRVRPVSLITGMVSPDVPQILINRESLPHCRFDVELLGNCDSIIAQLSKMMGSNFLELADGPELREIDKLPKGASSAAEEVPEPTSEHDIQALKACWEPKTVEKLSDRLPTDAYLCWRQRQYIFEGAEEVYDPDDDDDNDSSSSSDSSSCSSEETETRDKELEEDLKIVAGSETAEAASQPVIAHSSATETQPPLAQPTTQIELKNVEDKST